MINSELAEVFVSLRDCLSRYLRARVSHTVAEDLLQDIFVKALLAINAGRAPNNLSAWLHTVARSTVIDYYRSRREHGEIDENIPNIEQADSERLHQQLATCLQPLSLQLPAIYRETLLETDFSGRTMRSVAEQQGVSVSAIKSRASRGRKMLKQLLYDCCYIEIADGEVSDFHKHQSSCCDD